MADDPMRVPCPRCGARAKTMCRRIVAIEPKRVRRLDPETGRWEWTWTDGARKGSRTVHIHGERRELVTEIADMLRAAVNANKLRAWLATYGDIFRMPA